MTTVHNESIHSYGWDTRLVILLDIDAETIDLNGKRLRVLSYAGYSILVPIVGKYETSPMTIDANAAIRFLSLNVNGGYRLKVIRETKQIVIQSAE